MKRFYKRPKLYLTLLLIYFALLVGGKVKYGIDFLSLPGTACLIPLYALTWAALHFSGKDDVWLIRFALSAVTALVVLMSLVL